MNTNFTTVTRPLSWLQLNHSQLLLVQGADASKFLQGQVTCDLRELNSLVTRLGAQCNPKGRILLTFRALQINAETIALRIPSSMLENARQSLGKYIVFSKAKLIDGHDEYSLYGLYGNEASDLAKKIFLNLPGEDGGYVEHNGNFLIQLDSSGRYECWIHHSNITGFVQQIGTVASQGSVDDWKLLDIQAGIADIYPETFEQLTPQEINYQLINGISFRKGCYTGQEIVARLHYRGKLKRHMYRFRIHTPETPALATQVINSITQQAVGQVVMAARINAEDVEILASVLDEHLGALTLATNTQKLEQLPLPYAIPTADQSTE
ncbi:CAF17-like 4Fe-4S cluster assembly/insertion protein YgfZ [Cellvibrio mixtus]|uniref:CAF17-like 4Fe-4S cluster assembly/insertion protein YgfZ n=1 Tax=Cellvibrio mixtus TaxID=39650 RepID=UPI00058743D6|nr:folate-binding protein YgfZ [Cellvibrio mixtus]